MSESRPDTTPIRARPASRAPRTLYWRLRPGDRVSIQHGDQIGIVTCTTDKRNDPIMLLEAPIEFKVQVLPRSAHTTLGGDRVRSTK